MQHVREWCDCKWQTAPVLDNSVCKSVSSSSSPSLAKKYKWWPACSWPSGEREQLCCFYVYLVVQFLVGQDQIISCPFLSRIYTVESLFISKAFKVFQPPWCCPLYFFKVEYVHIEVGPVFAWMAYSKCVLTKALCRGTNLIQTC